MEVNDFKYIKIGSQRFVSLEVADCCYFIECFKTMATNSSSTKTSL